MKKIIAAAIICGIALVAMTARNFTSDFSTGLILGLVVVTILVGSSAIVAVKERRRQVWH
ncbi:hypothetical protein [Sporosarcina sp. A2]|uniref:hypothetical protein n=1 Tax=Sporosarcina sp. A2 TaxID=3393449 RepID=UPI003D79B5D1